MGTDTQTCREITDDEIAFYRDKGVVHLPGIVDTAWVERVRAAVEHDMAHPGPLVMESTPPGNPGRLFGDMFMWTWDPEFRAVVFESPLARAAGALIGSEEVGFLFDHLLVKEPGTSEKTPWHQDLPYWPVQGDQIVTLWLALDPVDLTNGGLEYVAGSHRWGERYEPVVFKADWEFDSSAGLPEIPDIDSHRDDYEILSFRLEPGDCLAHHALTIHGAPGNTTSGARRRGLATRWYGSDAVYDPHPGTASFIREPELEPGDHLPCELFPLVLRP